MPENPIVRRAARGVFTHPNELRAPPGALMRCSNGVIDREGVISKRRGFARYGDALSLPATAMFEFKNRLIVQDGGQLKYDSDGLGTWAAWAGTFVSPNANVRIRGLESNGNVYFPTQNGPYKNDLLTNTPRRAGMPQGLDVNVTKTGTGGDWFLPDSQVAYRVVWVRKDANSNEIYGAPSFAEIATNPAPVTHLAVTNGAGLATVSFTAHGFSTGDVVDITEGTSSLPADAGANFEANGPKTITVTNADNFTYVLLGSPPVTLGQVKVGKKHRVTIETTVPVDVVAGDFCEIYRTDTSATAATDPGNRFFRVTRQTYTAGTTISFVDTVEEDFLDLPLYTNDTEETENQANDRPPFATFIAQFKDHTFYGPVQREHSTTIQLTNISGITDDVDTVTINAGSAIAYTFSTAEDQGARKFKRYTTADAATPTLAQAVTATAKSLCKIINRDTSSAVYAFYVTTPEDPAVGKVEFSHRLLNSASFTVASSVGTKWEPSIASAVTSESDLQENFIGRSKAGRPEAVPFFNKMQVGRRNKRILSMVANKEALFIMKEDGIYVVTGESDGLGGSNFTVTEFDPTVILKGMNTAVNLNNAVHAYTSQNVTRNSGSETAILSRDVENSLARIAATTNFLAFSYGIAYESERKYLLVTPDAEIWVYNYLTSSWTTWDRDVNCGHVMGLEDRLYLADALNPYILRERKSLSYAGDDHMDESYSVTVSAVGTTVDSSGATVSTADVTWTQITPLVEGWHFKKGVDEALVTGVSSLGGSSFRLTLDLNLPLATGTATLSAPIPLVVEFAPESAGSAGSMKQFSEVSIYMETNSALHHQVGFLADTQNSEEFVSQISVPRLVGWGLQEWGNFAWGSPEGGWSTPVRTMVPRDHQMCRVLKVVYKNVYAKEPVNILEISYQARAFSQRVQREPA